jgi:hypothetical protein
MIKDHEITTSTEHQIFQKQGIIREYCGNYGGKGVDHFGVTNYMEVRGGIGQRTMVELRRL